MADNETSTPESTIDALSPGDEWPFHYRGYGLSINQDGDIWWQAYNGTDRFDLEPVPSGLVTELLELKRSGGALRVTEGGAVITRIETGDGSSDAYKTVYVGQIDLDGRLVPRDEPGHAVPISPNGLDPGDLWKSVYDGATYSFSGERFWWQDGETKLRHSFADTLPREITDELRGEITAILEDDAGEVTGDNRDTMLYRVQLEDGTEVDVRWRDLRPP